MGQSTVVQTDERNAAFRQWQFKEAVELEHKKQEIREERRELDLERREFEKEKQEFQMQKQFFLMYLLHLLQIQLLQKLKLTLQI